MLRSDHEFVLKNVHLLINVSSSEHKMTSDPNNIPSFLAKDHFGVRTNTLRKIFNLTRLFMKKWKETLNNHNYTKTT